MRDKATGRVVALIVLLIAVAASLRGYLPANERTPREPHATGNPASLAFVVALLGVSLAIIVIAVVTQLKDPRKVAPSAAGLSESFGGGTGRPTWRVLLIGLAVIVAWLLMVFLLTRFLHLGIGVHVSSTQPTATPASGNHTAPQPPSSNSPGSSGQVLGYLGTSTVLLLLVLAAATVVASRRRRRSATTAVIADDGSEPPAAPSGPESLVRAAERGLAEIEDLSREPREAIIACYAAMERELAHIPGSVPQDFDTATEVLARAVEHRALQADNAMQLVNLFAEARFSPHVMNEQHREAAVHVLQLVLAELSAQAGGRHRSVA
jgi:hypothetical protein